MLQLVHVPLVFTSFNDWEIEQDFQRLKDFAADTTGVDISVLMKPKLNRLSKFAIQNGSVAFSLLLQRE